MFKFQTLEVWQKAIEFTDLMVQIADSLPKQYQFTFGDQLRDAGLSIPSNIAEGTGRRTSKEARNFFNFSKGSVYECINILVILSKRNLFDHKKFSREKIYKDAEDICKMLTGLIKRET